MRIVKLIGFEVRPVNIHDDNNHENTKVLHFEDNMTALIQGKKLMLISTHVYRDWFNPKISITCHFEEVAKASYNEYFTMYKNVICEYASEAILVRIAYDDASGSEIYFGSWDEITSKFVECLKTDLHN